MKTLVVSAGVIALAAMCSAEVDLDWRVEEQGVPVGGTVRIGLYAVADKNGSDELFSAMEAVVEWNPQFLRLLDVDDNGPYDWMSSGFPNDIDGLNDTFEDGDAYYTALANFDEFARATPDGLLVTTFEFEALQATDGADVLLIEQLGYFALTAVYDDQYGGWNIVGDLGTASVRIGSCAGDLDGDGDTDQGDLGVLLSAFGVSDAGDLNGDGDTNQSDLGILLGDWGCGS